MRNHPDFHNDYNKNMQFNHFKSFENPLPPSEVHFVELKVEPWEDKTRIKVLVKISEFLSPPNFNFSIQSKDGDLLSEVTLIENVDTEFVFTMHLRSPTTQNSFSLLGQIFYQDEIGIVDSKSLSFTILFLNG